MSLIVAKVFSMFALGLVTWIVGKNQLKNVVKPTFNNDKEILIDLKTVWVSQLHGHILKGDNRIGQAIDKLEN